MKFYTKLFFMLSFLITPLFTFSMEKESEPRKDETEQEPMLCEDLGLPNEMWAAILAQPEIYVDLTIFEHANDIYEAIDSINKYIEHRFTDISLICKTFKNLQESNKRLSQLKQKIRELYIPHLNQKFLEYREDKEGLYPKNGEWGQNSPEVIGQFIATRTIKDNTKFLEALTCPVEAINELKKLFKVLLFYGFDINTEFNAGLSLLHLAILNYDNEGNNNAQMIHFLLHHGANPNLLNNGKRSPLDIAARDSHPINKNNIEIIKLLLNHGANPNFLINDTLSLLESLVLKYNPNTHNNIETIRLFLEHGANPNFLSWESQSSLLLTSMINHRPTTQNNIKLIKLLLLYGATPYTTETNEKLAFALVAKEQNITEFPELVLKYAKNSLKKTCILYIVKNLPLFKDKLDSLSIELKETINEYLDEESEHTEKSTQELKNEQTNTES